MTKKYVWADSDHVFRFKIGDRKVECDPCPVRYSDTVVQVILTEENVNAGLLANGQLNPGTCAGNQCVRKNKNVFPHPVIVEWVDWWKRRVFICSKVNKRGKPVECVIYKHDEQIAGEAISTLFDTEYGVKTLLAELKRRGPITITLHPVKKSVHTGRSGPSGKHRKNVGQGLGARWLTAQR